MVNNISFYLSQDFSILLEIPSPNSDRRSMTLPMIINFQRTIWNVESILDEFVKDLFVFVASKSKVTLKNFVEFRPC